MIAALALLLLAAQADSDQARLDKAQRLMDGGRCAEALPILKDLVTRYPRASTLKYGLGRCYFETDEYAAAATALREAARMLPKAAEVRLFLGSALAVNGKFSEGIAELQRAIELDKDFQPAYRAFGMFRVQQGQYFRDALEALQTAVRLDPEDARAHYWLGRFYQRIGDGVRARESFEKAHRLDSEDPLTRIGLGQALLADGEVERALGHFNAALAALPGYVPALLGRARALYNLGQAAQALPAAEAAHQGARGFEDERGSAWLLARVYRALERQSDAEAVERKLTRLEDGFAGDMARIRELSGQAARYRAENRLDKFAEALEEFLRIREIPEVLVGLGDAYLALDRPADAERCWLRAGEIGAMTDSLKQRLDRLRNRPR